MYRANTPAEWSESCAITGLEIKEGAGAWLVATDWDYGEGEGPCALYGTVSPPLAGTYNGRGGLTVPSDTASEQRYQLWCSTLSSPAKPDRTVSLSTVAGDVTLFWVSGEIFRHLGELPCHPDAGHPTVQAKAQARYTALWDLLVPHSASEVGGREEDPDEAYSLWIRSDHDEWFGRWKSRDELVSHLSSEDELRVLLEGERDSFMLFTALEETRRVYHPARGNGPVTGGNVAVGELARLTRRKALHAGFAPA